MLAALAALVALVTATLLASFSFVGDRSAAVSAVELQSADGPAGALVLQTRLGADPAAQADAFQALLRREAGDAVAPVTTLVGEPLTLTSPDEAFPTGRTSLVQVDWLVEHADLVAGSWAEDAAAPGDGRVAGTLPESAAAELGVAVGDVLLLGRDADTVVEVVGVWTPRVPSDPRWAGFASADVSGSAAAAGPVVVTDVAVAGGRPFVRWSVLGSGAPLDLAALTRAADGVARLPDVLAADEDLAPQGVTSAGLLGATLAELRVAAEAARTVCGVALVLLGVVGAATVSQVARLLAQARSGETAILAARGAAPTHLRRLVWGEAAGVAIVGTVVGAALAIALGAAMRTAAAVTAGWLLAVVLLTAAWALVLGVPGAGALRDAQGARTADRSGRGRALARSGVAVLLLLAAGTSLWRYTTTFAGPPADRTATDQAIAVVAPGLLTLALAVLALLALVPVWGLLEAVAGRARRLTTTLALRSVARRRAVLSVPLLLLVVAVATSVVGAGYAGSTATARALVEDTRVGADARVAPSGGAVVTAVRSGRGTADVLAVDGVEAAALVRTVDGRAGELDVAVEALPADGARAVLRGGTVPAGELADAIAVAPGVAVPAGAAVVSARLTGNDAAVSFAPELLPDALTGTLESVLWLVDDGGRVLRLEGVPAPVTGVDTTVAITADVPEGAWTLLGVDVAASGPGLAPWRGLLDVVLDGVEVGGAPLQLEWSHLDAAGLVGSGVRASGGSIDSPGARFTPPVPDRLPVVVTTALADRLAVRVGDGVALTLGGADVDVEVAAVADLLPGALDAPAALVDLVALQRTDALQRRPVSDADEIWVALADGAAAADAVPALRALVRDGGGIVTASGTGASAGTAVAQPVFLAVAAVATLLAAVGTLAAVDVLTRTRRGEVVALRAIGVPGRVQGRSRLLETLVLGAAALPAGLVVGGVVASLTMPTLVRLSVVGLADDTSPLRLAWPALGAGLLLAVAGVVAAAVLSAGRVRRQHADTEHREETR
ncbi:FtsX-like permease family protein [Serinibacter arcticus]|nr:FtsX-like permease family protein [Serinibacter arcticus]